MEAVRLMFETKDAELKVHIFLGMPMSPGAPCPGEDSKFTFIFFSSSYFSSTPTFLCNNFSYHFYLKCK